MKRKKYISRFFRQLSIRKKLALFIMIVALLSVMYLVAVSVNMVVNITSEKNTEIDTNRIVSFYRLMKSSLNGYQNKLTAVIQIPILRQIVDPDVLNKTETETLRLSLRSKMKDIVVQTTKTDEFNPAFVNIYCKNGFSCAYPLSKKLPFDNYESCIAYFVEQNFMELSGVFTTPYCGTYLWSSPGGDDEMILFTLRILYDSFTLERSGILVAGLRVTDLDNLRAADYNNGFLLDCNEKIIMSDNTAEVGTLLSDAYRFESLFDTNSPYGIFIPETGNVRSFAYARIVRDNLLFLVPISSSQQIPVRQVYVFFLLTLIGLVLVLILSVYLAKKLSAPALILKSTVERAYRNQPALAAADGDELTYLDHHINDMLEQINAANLYHQHMEEILPMLQERFMENLVNYEEQASDLLLAEQMSAIHLEFCEQRYAVALLVPRMSSLQAEDFELMMQRVKSYVAQQLCEAGFRFFLFFDSAFHLICIVNDAFNDGDDSLKKVMLRFSDDLSAQYDLKVAVGISNVCEHLSELYLSRREAALALHNQISDKTRNVVCYGDSEPVDVEYREASHRILNEVMVFLRSNQQEKTLQILEQHFDDTLIYQLESCKDAREFLLEYVSVLMLIGAELGLKMSDLFSHFESFSRIAAAQNIYELRHYALELTNDFYEVLLHKCKYKTSSNAMIESAKHFIHSHLGDQNLSLKMVSDSINLSDIYFCKLFHQSENVTFNDYLNHERIHKACCLLRETSLLIFEISEQTGYQNPKYFNYVFKRLTDVTPTEYRKSFQHP